jgi:hypothetical protein
LILGNTAYEMYRAAIKGAPELKNKDFSSIYKTLESLSKRSWWSFGEDERKKTESNE